jgi:zinc protease
METTLEERIMPRHLSFAALLAGLALAGGATAAVTLDGAAPAPALTDPIPVNPHLKLGKLPNGLTYYIEQNARPAQRVELRLVVNAGSVLEDEDQRGMAHLLEHLAYNGSTHFKKHELVAYLQSIGVRFGADLNAETGFDHTLYKLPIPVDKPGNLELGFTVLEDWAHGLLLSDKDIDDERAIILEEKRLRSGYANRAQEVVLPLLFNGSRYKDRLPIGTEESILHAKPDAVRRFYTDWYRPDLMAVVVVGDVDPAEAEQMVKRHFGGIAMPAKPRPRPVYALPPLEKAEAGIFLDKEAPRNDVQLTYSLYQGKPEETVGDFRAQLVRNLFSLMMSMRFNRLTQAAEPPFVRGGAGDTPLPFGVNQRAYAASATVGKAGVGAAIDALVKESARARAFGFTEADLASAKRSLTSVYERAASARETSNSAAVLGEYVRNFLTGEIIPGAAQENAYAQALLPDIGLEDVNAYAKSAIPAAAPKQVLYTANTSTVVAGQAAPTGPELLARVEAAAKLPVARGDDKPQIKSLMSYQPEPGRIVEQSEDKSLGTTTLLLSNGVRVMLKPTDFTKDSVQMLAVRRGGQWSFPDADKKSLRFASAVHGAMGVGTFTPSALQSYLSPKGVSASAAMTGYTDQLVGHSRRSEIETMLQLIYLQVNQPRRDETLFRSYVTRSAESVRNRAFVPEVRFTDARLQTVFGGNPRVELMPTAADFEALDLDRSQSLFRSRMSSVKGMTFLFVGDFDVEKVKPLLARYVATLPVGDVGEGYRDPGIRQVPGVVRREFKAGTEQKSIVTFDFGGDVSYSQPESWALGLMVEVMKIRMVDELRERLKLVYASSASASYEKIPRGAYSVSFTLPTAPQNVDKVETALWAEIEKLQAQGPAAEDLDKVKQARLQSYRQSIRENGYWMNYLRMGVVEDKDVHDILKVEQAIDAVTADDVKAAARRFLDRKNYVEMVLKPEA